MLEKSYLLSISVQNLDIHERLCQRLRVISRILSATGSLKDTQFCITPTIGIVQQKANLPATLGKSHDVQIAGYKDEHMD